MKKEFQYNTCITILNLLDILQECIDEENKDDAYQIMLAIRTQINSYIENKDRH